METQDIKNLRNARLDVGCGGNKQKGFIGMDKRELPGIDIIHDIEVFPWPLSDNSCTIAVASHVVEHIKPWLMIAFMDEVWRVLTPGSDFAISVPYAGSRGFWQDPTHCNGCNEVTWQYFDPTYPLYNIYKPKPWGIHKGFPVYQDQGNMEVIMRKLEKDLGEAQSNVQSKELGISVADGTQVGESMVG